MNYISALASFVIFALLIGTWLRVVWWGFIMWGPL
jgi:hypothetical protein